MTRYEVAIELYSYTEKTEQAEMFFESVLQNVEYEVSHNDEWVETTDATFFDDEWPYDRFWLERKNESDKWIIELRVLCATVLIHCPTIRNCLDIIESLMQFVEENKVEFSIDCPHKGRGLGYSSSSSSKSST